MKQKALYGIGIVFALVLLVGIAVLPFVAFRYLGFSETEARLLGSSLAAASTFGLVIVTYITVRQNQQIVERQEKELEKERQGDFVHDIILPSKELVERNRNRILSDSRYISWSESPISKGSISGDTVNNLFKICQREDIDSSELKSFESEYPDIYEDMLDHDQMLDELNKCASKFYEDGITELYGYRFGEEGKTNLAVNADKEFVADSELSGASGHNSRYYEEWNFRECREAAEENYGDELERFERMKVGYAELCRDLELQLEELRQRISENYKV
jgi:hypothetical protein